MRLWSWAINCRVLYGLEFKSNTLWWYGNQLWALVLHCITLIMTSRCYTFDCLGLCTENMAETEVNACISSIHIWKLTQSRRVSHLANRIMPIRGWVLYIGRYSGNLIRVNHYHMHVLSVHTLLRYCRVRSLFPWTKSNVQTSLYLWR